MKESLNQFSERQEIVSSQPLLREKGSLGRKEDLSRTEALQNIGVVEDIARARVELEEQILNKGLPSAQWMDCWKHEVLPKHPTLIPYGSFFIEAIRTALLANRSVRSLCKDTVRDIKEKFGIAGRTSEISYRAVEESDRALFQKIFGKYPQGLVVVEPGAVSLDFIVFDDDDFAVALETSKEEAKSTSGFAFVFDALEEYGAIPIVVARFGKDVEGTKRHELEHLKNDLLAASKRRILDDIIGEELDQIIKKVVAKIERRQKRVLAVEDWAKDEILAQTQEGVGELRDEHIKTWLVDLAGKFAAPDGFYYKEYFFEQRAELEESSKGMSLAEQELIYQKSVSGGLAALESLFDLYGKEKQILVGILEQFPLRSWPAVARLLKMRHRKFLKSPS